MDFLAAPHHSLMETSFFPDTGFLGAFHSMENGVLEEISFLASTFFIFRFYLTLTTCLQGIMVRAFLEECPDHLISELYVFRLRDFWIIWPAADPHWLAEARLAPAGGVTLT